MLFHENIRCTVYGFKAMSNDKSGKSYRDIILLTKFRIAAQMCSGRGLGTWEAQVASFHSDLRGHGTHGGKGEDKEWISFTKLDRLVKDMKVNFRGWGHSARSPCHQEICDP